MRDYLLIYVNGRRHEVRGANAWSTLSDYLRRDLGLCGTKVVCAEGDCGACSVLVGRPVTDGEQSRLEYRVLDSCIQFLFQLDASHVVTVEGLGQPDSLHPVQSSMIDHYGSQCGFCTPGFVTTIAGLAEDARQRGDANLGGDDGGALERGLTGNLCRCTGYVQILEAARSISIEDLPALASLYPESALCDSLQQHARDEVSLDDRWSGSEIERQLVIPRSIESGLEFLDRCPSARVIAGGTDLGVQSNKGRLQLENVLVLSDRIPDLAGVTIQDNVLVAGAAASWSRVLETIERRVPQLAEILEVFGAPQIRNAATLGGNVVNASPIADSVPFLMVCGATLEIEGPNSARRVAIEDFYRGYKDLDLESHEIVTRIVAPLPTEDETLRLYKMSKRRDLDISSFTAAILLRIDGDTIVRARVALGGVGPVVSRLVATEQALENRPMTLETMSAAGLVARSEIQPISDVRGGAEYRRQLAENTFLRFFYDTQNPQLETEYSTT